MPPLLTLAWRSAWHRRFGLSLVVLTIALSGFLLLSVERVRHDLRETFARSISGTDLVVGARGGSLQLMLYAVFRIGEATQNIRWSSVQALSADPAVDWVVPISLGDSYRGYPVVATRADYFQHFRYGEREPLVLAQGGPFVAVHDAVLGAELAARLGHRLGDRLVLRHGAGSLASNDHADQPFRVVGVLAPTGTPVDRSLHISLAGMEAIHAGWIAGLPMPGRRAPPGEAEARELQPRSVTAALVGLKSRAAVFGAQRRIQAYEGEPLMAVLPGVALDQLWTAVGGAERALLLMSGLVGAVSLCGLVAVVVTALDQRRRELSVLRSIGAGPWRVFTLLALEGGLLAAAGALLGALAWAAALGLLSPWLQGRFGLTLQLSWPRATEWGVLAAVVAAGTLASLLPGWRAYRLSLADGLSPRDA